MSNDWWSFVVDAEKYLDAAKPAISLLTFAATFATLGVTSMSAYAIRSLKLQVDIISEQRDDLQRIVDDYFTKSAVGDCVKELDHQELHKNPMIDPKKQIAARQQLAIPNDETIYGLFDHKRLLLGRQFIAITQHNIYCSGLQPFSWPEFLKLEITANGDILKIGDNEVDRAEAAVSYAKVLADLKARLSERIEFAD